MAGASPMRIIVSGLIAQYPLGGVSWDYLQYVLGLRRLGHDVYYIEDTGHWPYNPREGGVSERCDDNVRYLAELMDRFGLGSRWAYRFTWGSRWYGMPEPERQEVIETADLLLNVSGTLMRPEDYRSVKRLVYIDSDPVFTQIKLARGQLEFEKSVACHDVHFSFGERLGSADATGSQSSVPATDHQWIPTRQLIVLDEWQPAAEHREVFTTVMNWTSYKPVSFAGQTYGQKDVEFERYLDLPFRVAPTSLELAVQAGKVKRTPYQRLVRHGWKLVDPDRVCPDLDSYRTYLRHSKAEWSVAKNGYVKGVSGWFSCRSACYLAAGRPVVVQDTGFSTIFPVGEGLLAFSTPDEAVAAIIAVNAEPARHVAAARELAFEYFDSDKVLNHLIEQATAGYSPTQHSRMGDSGATGK